MVRRPCVYKKLAMIMFMNNISICDLAKKSHMNYKTLCRKLNGDTAVTIEDAIDIHRILGNPMPIEELFSRE